MFLRKPAPVRRMLPVLYLASGAAALMLEVTWSRLLTLQFGHTTGATSTVLAAFMGGLAIGSAIGGTLAERRARRAALKLYAAFELVIAIAAVMLPLVIAAATPLLEWAYADGQAPTRFGIARVVASLLALAVPTMAMGATYPLATRALAADRRHAEQAAGWLYTANTIGAATGALLAGFVLLPMIGIRATTFVAAALNVAAAAAAWRLAHMVVEGASSALSAATDEGGADSSRTVQGAGVTSPSSMDRSERGAGAGHVAAPQSGEKSPRTSQQHLRAETARRSAVRQGKARDRTARRVSPEMSPSVPRLVGVGLFAAAMSGLVALANQVVWTRVLALIVGPTTFAFSGMVGVFIAGLAVGAALGTRLAGGRAAVWLGVMGLASAVAMTVAMQLTGRLLLWVAASAVASPARAFDLVVWRELAVAALLLGPLSLTFGAAFPLALAVVGRGAGLTPARVSWTYAANTAGAIAGALLAGFVLIPAFGLQSTLRMGAMASVVVGLLVLFVASARASWRGRLVATVAAAFVMAGVLTRARWDPALLASGAYRYAPAVAVPPEDLEAVLTAGDLLFYREGSAGTVAVRRLAGTTSLIIDGKPDASNAGDMLTQKLLAHLPLLLHPSPSRVCVLGLGSGVTAGAALTHPVSQLDLVEISPAVVEASRFFRAENRGVLDDPRTRLLVADGRSHLRLSDARYDVVISEPSNPWMAGVAALFTREFMAGVRSRLAPGGVFCQWTHTYDMSPAELRSIAATFLGEFPHASLWLVGESDVLLIGSSTPLPSDVQTIASRLARPGVAEDLRTVAVSGSEDLAGLRIAGTDTGAGANLNANTADALHRYASGASPQTDDRLALEFSAPRSMAARTGHENVAELLALSAAPVPSPASPPARSARTAAGWASRGRMLLRAEAYDLALAALRQAVAARPDDEDTLEAYSRAAAGAGRLEEASRDLRARLDANPTNVPLRAAFARLLMARGDADGAIAAIISPTALSTASSDATTAATDGPHAAASLLADPRALRELASIYADLGDADRLAPVVARLERAAPAATDTPYFAASLAFLRGDLDTALTRARAVVGAHPQDARAWNLIGAALATAGDVDGARAAFAQSLAADPRAAGTYVNAGSLELEHGRPDEARRHFAIALTIDATHTAARQGLAAARAARR